MDTTMKGLLKGLRYIAQIFEDEKEPEMQIGNPTDVKHVAHIGWDAQSVDTPSWMKEFKSESTPSSINGEAKENSQTQMCSQDSCRKAPKSVAKDLPELPKSSRRGASFDDSSTAESLTKSLSRRRYSTSATKGSSDGAQPCRLVQDLSLGSESHTENQADIPKKSRRKKTK